MREKDFLSSEDLFIDPFSFCNISINESQNTFDFQNVSLQFICFGVPVSKHYLSESCIGYGLLQLQGKGRVEFLHSDKACEFRS